MDGTHSTGMLSRFSNEVMPEVQYVLEVHDVLPKYGSQEGGTLLTLRGAGFSSDCAENVVTVGGVACEIESCTGVTIVCETSSHSTVHKISNSGKHPGTVKLKTSNWERGVSKSSNVNLKYKKAIKSN